MPAVAAALVVALALVVTAPAAADVGLREVGIFDSPVHVTGAPGDPERLYVVEQPGVIRVVRDGSSSVFADLTGPVAADGSEEGLLSVAFAPDFQTTRLLYLFFTNEEAGHDLEIAELRAPTGDAVDPGSLRRVLEIEHDEANNHNGGQLQFGPDGYLYIATGDGGNSYDDPTDDAVSTTSLLGKILRIDPRGSAPGEHVVPPDNPFGNQVWSYGLRNPWRFSFDHTTGDLIIGDVGQNAVEEVNHVTAADGAGGGANFGWDECEGNFDSKPSPTGSDPCGITDQNYVPPAIPLMHGDGFCSVIGGYVVGDQSLPSLLGRYVYGDLCSAPLRSAELTAGGASDDRAISPPVEVSPLTSFGEDASGCLYATSAAGGVYRIVENDTRATCEPTDAGGGGAGGTGAGGGAAGGGAAGGPGDTAADRTGPRLTARVKRRQRVLRLGGPVARVRCDEPCSVASGGWVRIGRRIYRMQHAVHAAQATSSTRVKVRLRAEGRRALRMALLRGTPIRLRVGLRARDALGNTSPLERRTVRVTR
jgi:hypothetical protein